MVKFASPGVITKLVGTEGGKTAIGVPSDGSEAVDPMALNAVTVQLYSILLGRLETRMGLAGPDADELWCRWCRSLCTR